MPSLKVNYAQHEFSAYSFEKLQLPTNSGVDISQSGVAQNKGGCRAMLPFPARHSSSRNILCNCAPNSQEKRTINKFNIQHGKNTCYERMSDLATVSEKTRSSCILKIFSLWTTVDERRNDPVGSVPQLPNVASKT